MPRFLTKEELQKLLKVKTTPKEARQIIKRNKVVLDWIRKNPKVGHLWNLACPHCQRNEHGVFNCNKCAYRIVEPNVSMPCTYMCFGGFYYQHFEICHTIGLGSNYISYEPDCKTTPEHLFAVRIWLQGHIEWAKKVIRLAETKKKSRNKPSRR